MQQPNFVTIRTKLTYQRDSNNIRSQTVWYTFEKKESEKLGYTKSPGRPDDNWEEWRELFSWRKPSSKDSHRSAGMRFVGANCIYEMMLCQHSAPFHIPLKQKVKNSHWLTRASRPQDQLYLHTTSASKHHKRTQHQQASVISVCVSCQFSPVWCKHPARTPVLSFILFPLSRSRERLASGEKSTQT